MIDAVVDFPRRYAKVKVETQSNSDEIYCQNEGRPSGAIIEQALICYILLVKNFQ